MDKDRITGAATKAKGAFKDALGSATGDRKMQAGGKLDKAKGSVQGALGRAKDAVRGALNRRKDLTRWHIIEPISRLTAHPSEEARCAVSHA